MYAEFLEAPPDEQSEVEVAKDGTLALPPRPTTTCLHEVAALGEALAGHGVGRRGKIAHAGRVDPAVVEVEERDDRAAS